MTAELVSLWLLVKHPTYSLSKKGILKKRTNMSLIPKQTLLLVESFSFIGVGIDDTVLFIARLSCLNGYPLAGLLPFLHFT